MAEADGFLVYKRGQSDNDSDIWDDSALIKAYDNAVAIMKAKMVEKEDATEDQEKAGNSTKRKSKRRKKRKATKLKKKWKVGDHCRAMFTEDGVVYESVILSVNDEDQTCFVRYTGYGNEEQQSLANLLPPSRSSKQNSDIENMSDMEWAGQSPSAQHSHRSTSRSRKTSDHIRDGFGATPFMSHPPFSFPAGFPQWPRMSAPRVPLVPPPPPPLVQDFDDLDNDALCSMLLAWYMSGYHTGYYQGLKQGHADSGMR